MRALLYPAALLLTLPASAQIVSVYATYSPTHFSNVETVSVTNSAGVSAGYGSFWSNNIGGGVTLGILPIGPVHIGLDVRGSTKRGDHGSDTALGGLRLAIKPPVLPLKPYVQVSGGYVATRAPTPPLSNVAQPGVTTTVYFENHYAALEVIGGVDYRLARLLDFRLIEGAYGRGFNTGKLANAPGTSSQITFFTLSSGLVLHF